MNALSPQFQAGQNHFGGYQLLRQVSTDAAGMVTWLAQRGAESFLLHILPIHRPLSENEKAPLVRQIHHGQQRGRRASQMTLRDVCVEDGQPPVTALVEAFPPRPEGETDWQQLTEWTALYGPATTAKVTPHLPLIARWLSELPTLRHGRLSPEQCWICGHEGNISAVALASAGLVDFQKQLPETGAAAIAWDDVAGLGHLLYHWLTGKTPPPSNHRQVLKDLGSAHSGEDRTPDHWQRLIASNVDADPLYRSPTVYEMVDALLHPVSASSIEEVTMHKPRVVSKELLSKVASVVVVVILGFLMLGWLNNRPLSGDIAHEPQAPLPAPPEFVPRPAPAPEVTVVKPDPESRQPDPDKEKPALLPVPQRPTPPPVVIVAVAKPTPAPQAEPLERKQPETAKQTSILPKIRIPYRPPPPPTSIERRTSSNTPPQPVKIAAPPVAKAQPPTESAPPKAIPIAQALTVHETTPSVTHSSPVVVQAVPVAERLVQAVPLPEEMPLPRSYNLDVPPAILTPPEAILERPLVIPPSAISPRGPDKPLWVRPSQP